MRNRSRVLIVGLFIFAFVAVACSLPEWLSFIPLPSAEGAVKTAAVKTAAMRLTEISLGTQVSNVIIQQTLGPEGVYSLDPLTANTTPVPGAKTAAPPKVTPCNWVGFIRDVTIPDNTVYTPGVTITKVWRLKNKGTCTWTPDYDLVFTGGASMSGPQSVDLNSNVPPGATVDVSVTLVTPGQPGAYIGYWQLRAPDGTIFGWGNAANGAFWVKITVENTPSAPDPKYTLDFVRYYCTATWTSPRAATLGCPGASEDYANGAVTTSFAPKLEVEYQADEAALIMIPSDGIGGMISGKFPAIDVQAGDHFSATIGCMNNSPKCNVMFSLDYIADNGPVMNLGSWTEIYDGNRTRINVDLSNLEGRTVQLILKVLNNDDTSVDDRAFWLAPQTVR